MAKLKHSRAKRLILDIGNSAIRLCELSPTKTGYQLTKYYQRETSIDPASDEEAKREIRRETLKSLLKDAKVRTKRSLFAVPGQSVFTRTRALPPVPEYKVTQIVRYEIQQQIPFSLDQIALDYQVLNRTEAGGYEVLMAAIKVDVVEKRLETLRDVKRHIDTVDVAPLAAYNWLKHTGEFGDQGECVAMIDLGASTTDLVIEREKQFRFTRSLNLGGNDVTSALAGAFGLSFADAEKLKREKGFAPSGDPQRDGKGGDIVGQVLARLVGEISRSFAYFRSQPGGGTVSRVIVTGGGACLRNIIPYLQRQLGVEVRIAQPLAGLAIGPAAQEVNERPEQATVVLGLALRTCESVPIEINLIPPRIQQAALRKEQAFYWALSFATLALIFASIIPVSANKNKNVRNQIALVTQTIAMYDPKLQPDPTRPSELESRLRAAKGLIENYQKEAGHLDDTLKARQFWLDKLLVINDARPAGEGIWFSSIETGHIGGAGPGAARSGALAPVGTFGPAGPSGGAQSGGEKLFQSLQGSGIGASPMLGGVAGKPKNVVDVKGFPGLTPLVEKQAKPAPGAKPEPPRSLPPEEQNALSIRGYALKADTIQQFVQNLKKSKEFIEGGVYFSDAFANPVPITDLDHATGLATPNPAASQTIADEDERDAKRDRGGLGSGSGGFTLTRPGGSAGPVSGGANVPTVVAFRVDVQLSGTPVQLEEITTVGSAAAGAAGRGGAGGVSAMRSQRKLQEEEEAAAADAPGDPEELY
ncbi:MAG: type IV pilus assembly protein PilM [Candidatus Hydrogenedentes bacterium]|nr:type IV pilus assembly protein PilM [Candidatus Hydrogenedentota bacterium]